MAYPQSYYHKFDTLYHNYYTIFILTRNNAQRCIECVDMAVTDFMN